MVICEDVLYDVVGEWFCDRCGFDVGFYVLVGVVRVVVEVVVVVVVGVVFDRVDRVEVDVLVYSVVADPDFVQVEVIKFFGVFDDVFDDVVFVVLEEVVEVLVRVCFLEYADHFEFGRVFGFFHEDRALIVRAVRVGFVCGLGFDLVADHHDGFGVCGVRGVVRAVVHEL